MGLFDDILGIADDFKKEANAALGDVKEIMQDALKETKDVATELDDSRKEIVSGIKQKVDQPLTSVKKLLGDDNKPKP